jgi:hypothetical protein
MILPASGIVDRIGATGADVRGREGSSFPLPDGPRIVSRHDTSGRRWVGICRVLVQSMEEVVRSTRKRETESPVSP